MKKVSYLMIEKFNLSNLGYDFMGYNFDEIKELSFHHLIVPRRNCKEKGLGRGFVEWNGAILNKDTAHKYLHIIEHYDYDMFMAISSEMIDQNIKGYLDYKNIKNINDILNSFEREYCGKRSNAGQLLIQEEYTRRLIKK